MPHSKNRCNPDVTADALSGNRFVTVVSKQPVDDQDRQSYSPYSSVISRRRAVASASDKTLILSPNRDREMVRI